MNLVQTAIRQPVTVAVGVLLVLLAGLLSFSRIPIQLTPNVEDTIVSVRTLWPGASPEEVEQEIVDEQEEFLQGIAGLKSMTSTCQQGVGQVKLEFAVGTSKDRALRDVSDKLREVPDYPDNVEEPVVEASDPENRDYIAWIVFETTDPSLDIRTLQDFAEDRIEPMLERAEGISEINVLGGRKRVVEVRFDPLLLAQRGVTPSELVAAIQRTNQNRSAGTVAESKSDVRLRLISQYESVEEVQRTVVRRTASGTILLSDVAEVVETYQEPTSFVRSRGNPVIAINAQKEVGANVMEVMRNLRAQLDKLNAPGAALDAQARKLGLDGKLTLTQVYDQTIYIDDALALVQSNIWIGGGLAMVVLLLFLRSLRSAGIIALAIPISVVGAVVAMVAMGRTVNVISLAGMAFAVGMVVDNAIVVLENVHRHLEMGKPAMRAAYDGTREVFGAVLAATLTTVVVFVPILLIEEEAGQLFRDIALAIVAAVTLSLIVSVTVIPTCAARLLRPVERQEGAPRRRSLPVRLLLFPTRIPDWSYAAIHALCGSVLARVTIVAGLTAASIFGTAALLPPSDYLPQGNRNLVFGLLVPPPGYNIGQLQELAKRVETTVRPFYEAGRLELGSEEYERAKAALPEVPTFDMARMAPGPPVVPPPLENYFLVSFTGAMFHGGISKEPDRVQDMMPLFAQATRSEVAPGVLAFAFQLPLFRLGGRTGSAVKINFTGDDLAQVTRAALAVYQDMMGQFGAYAVQPDPSNFNIPSPEVQVHPDRERLGEVGMTPDELGLFVQALGDGATIGDFRVGGQTIDLDLVGRRDAGGESQVLGELADVPIATPAGDGPGAVVPLGSLARLQRVNAANQINRDARQRAVTLQFTPPVGLPLEQAVAQVDELLARHRAQGSIPPEVETSYTGSASKLAAVRKAMLGDGSLTGTLSSSLALALLVVYLLMCVLFQSFSHPLIILFSVPLATLGGFAALYGVHTWSLVDPYMPIQNLDVLTMLGFVILIGVVVNNAILIVHQTLNFMRGEASTDGWAEEPLAPREAIAESVRSRVRPIFMSTLTSVGGMAPLVFMPGSGSELYRGLGSVVVGGLLVSTIFTLLLVPLLFSLVLDAQALLRRGREDRTGSAGRARAAAGSAGGLLLALLALTLVGCASRGPEWVASSVSGADVARGTAEHELAQLGPQGAPPRAPEQPSGRVDEALAARRAELERLGGPPSWSGSEPALQRDLAGEPQRLAPLTLAEVLAAAEEYSLSLHVARLGPALADTDRQRELSAFDSLLFAELSHARNERPNRVPVLGGIQLGSPVSGSAVTSWSGGVERRLRAGTTLSATTFLERYDDRSSGIDFAPDPAWTSGVAVGLEQPLLRGAGSTVNEAQLRLAESRVEGAKEDLTVERLDVLAAAETAYWNLFEAWQRLAIFERLVAEGRAVESVLSSRRSFDAQPAQYADALATVESRRAELMRAERDVRAASDVLKSLLDDPRLSQSSELLLRPTDLPDEGEVEIRLREAVETALAGRPELRRARLAIDDARLRADVARDEVDPNLDLFAELSLTGLDDDTSSSYSSLTEDDYASWLVGLRYELPLGSRAASADRRRAELESRAAILEYQRVARAVVLEVKRALRDLVTSRELIATTRAFRVAQTENLRALTLEEERRSSLTPEFLSLKFQRQERLARAQLDEVGALAGYDRGRVAWRRALGLPPRAQDGEPQRP